MECHGHEIVELLKNENYFGATNQIVDYDRSKQILDVFAEQDAFRIIIVKGRRITYCSPNGFYDNPRDYIGKEYRQILSGDECKQMERAYGTNHPEFYETNSYLQCIVSTNDGKRFEDADFVIIRANTESAFSGYWHLIKRTIIIDLIILILLIIVACFYSRYLIGPLKQLVVYIGRLTDGYLNEQITMKSYTEVEEIVDSINSMTRKLETLESSRQEFVSNVSHELKTPITSIKVLADSLLQQEDAPAELYREFLSDINAEIERENKIITDLLSLVKMDKSESELNIENINVNELCEQILKRIKPIADMRNISLTFESYRPVMADVDEVKLSLAINNLIENAVKYNFDDGWVRVSLNADHKFFYIKVADSGVGIPEDEQENVFERFYRVDKARSRDTGGTGLGLAITRNAILVHRGAIKIYSKEKEGTIFTVRIPLNYNN